VLGIELRCAIAASRARPCRRQKAGALLRSSFLPRPGCGATRRALFKLGSQRRQRRCGAGRARRNRRPFWSDRRGRDHAYLVHHQLGRSASSEESGPARLVGWRELRPRRGSDRRLLRTGLGEYFVYQSAMLAVASVKALNSYFQMPFANGAKLTVTNEGKIAPTAFTLRSIM
jgi:hypothetical protein